MNIKSVLKSFSIFEISLWFTSITAILVCFYLFSGNILSLIASLIGATALILVSKGNVIGQILTVVFAILYGVISYTFKYYGEMITYLGMSAPIAIFAVIAWLKNPYNSNKTQVKVNHLKAKELVLMCLVAFLVSIIFYYILLALNTSYLIMSTVSVFTSFAASYLTMRRSEYYGIAYGANDIVLIVLWVLATLKNKEYLPMCICFVIFLINDIYGFINWLKIKKSQAPKIHDSNIA